MSRKVDKGLTKAGKKRERVSALPVEVRAFTFGLIMGVAGESYKPSTISRMVNERFGYNVSPKAISNWKYNLPQEMQKHDITEGHIKEAIARGLLGDQRTREQIEEELKELEGKKLREVTPDEVPVVRDHGDEGKVPLTFNNTAEIISYCEGQGFIVGKDLEDIKLILAANNLRVIDDYGELIGIEDIFITPIELNIDVVGRNIVANPIIGFYYAYERKRQNKSDLDIAQWITTCIAELYGNLDKIYSDRRPVTLGLIYG